MEIWQDMNMSEAALDTNSAGLFLKEMKKQERMKKERYSSDLSWLLILMKGPYFFQWLLITSRNLHFFPQKCSSDVNGGSVGSSVDGDEYQVILTSWVFAYDICLMRQG